MRSCSRRFCQRSSGPLGRAHIGLVYSCCQRPHGALVLRSFAETVKARGRVAKLESTADLHTTHTINNSLSIISLSLAFCRYVLVHLLSPHQNDHLSSVVPRFPRQLTSIPHQFGASPENFNQTYDMIPAAPFTPPPRRRTPPRPYQDSYHRRYRRSPSPERSDGSSRSSPLPDDNYYLRRYIRARQRSPSKTPSPPPRRRARKRSQSPSPHRSPRRRERSPPRPKQVRRDDVSPAPQEPRTPSPKRKRPPAWVDDREEMRNIPLWKRRALRRDAVTDVNVWARSPTPPSPLELRFEVGADVRAKRERKRLRREERRRRREERARKHSQARVGKGEGEEDKSNAPSQSKMAVEKGSDEDSEPVLGPSLPPKEARDYGKDLRPNEGSKMAAFVQEGVRIPRRGEIGLTGEQIADFEKQGYVMSGSRNRRMEAVRIRKENQVYSAEERAALNQLDREQKMKREQTVLKKYKEMVEEKLGKEGE